MKDLKNLYNSAKFNKTKADVTAYVEAVKMYLESNPYGYISNLEYIITSDMGANTLKNFVETHGLPIECYEDAKSILENTIDRGTKLGKDVSVFKCAAEYLESYRKKYFNCFMMYEYYKNDESQKRDKVVVEGTDITVDKLIEKYGDRTEAYVEAYYSYNKNGIQGRKLPAGLINSFGEMAVADALITSDMINGGEGTAIIHDFCMNHYTENSILMEWLDFTCENLLIHNYCESVLSGLHNRSLSSKVSNFVNKYQKIFRESVITGNEMMMEYTEEDIDNIKNLISFKEYQMTWADEIGEGAATKLQKEIYSLYESLVAIMEDGDADLVDMLPGTPVEEGAPWVVNTRDKKTGGPATYISRNHDMAKYGEDDDENVIKSKSSSEMTADDFRRPSAGGDEENTNDDSSEEDSETDTSKDTNNNQAVQNYYYYTYNNSLNKNNHSFNKDNSTKDDHSVHRSNRTYDSSQGKHVNSHNNNVSGNTDDSDEGENEFSDVKESAAPWELNGDFGNFTKSSGLNEVCSAVMEEFNELLNESFQDFIKNTYMTEATGENKFQYAYKAAYNYENGHALKITYSLDNIVITAVGDLKPLRDELLAVTKDVVSTATDGKKLSNVRSVIKGIKGSLKMKSNVEQRKKFLVEFLSQYIKDTGYVDFQAKNCKIIEIYDRYEKKKISGTVKVVGVYAASDFNKEKSLCLSEYAYDRMRKRVDRKGSNFKISEIKEGDTQTIPTFMTTHWDDHADKGLVDVNGKVIKDDDTDHDNSAMIQTANEFHGFDFGASGKTLTDALVDFIAPVQDMCFAKGRDAMAKFNTAESEKLITKQRSFINDIKKAIEKVEGDDNKSLKDLLSKEEKRLTSAESALSSNDHEDVFNQFLDVKSSYKKFAKIIDKLSDDYENLPSTKAYTEAVGDADDDKPESDHPIKDILTDIDRATVKKQQAMKKKVQDMQNVGRAMMKPVNRTKEWVGNMIGKWKDADETNIKERMADPHARSNLFSAIKKSIVGGSLLKAGLLLNPVFLFLTVTRGIGKNKREFRIRNEMIGEIKTEIQIIDEKIKDADSKGDNKAKYQLMRFKNELNKKLLRVGGGKKWAKIL